VKTKKNHIHAKNNFENILNDSEKDPPNGMQTNNTVKRMTGNVVVY
jgi:hypothetical protein